MRKTPEEFTNGLIAYVDNEMLVKLGTWKKLLLGAFVSLAVEQLPDKIRELMHSEVIKMLDVCENERIDIDRLYSALKTQFRGGKTVEIELPVLGIYKADENDLDKLYQHICEA